MRWSLNLLLIGFASIASALLPGWHLIDSLNELTTTTKFLLGPARDINLQNAPQIVIRRGPLFHVLDGLRGFFREGSALDNQFRGEEGFHDDEAEEVLYALQSLLNVNKMLVDIFHEKAHLLQNIPALGKPIATGIQSVDTIIKVLTNDIVYALPADLARQAEKAQTQLSTSLKEAISTYSSFEKLEIEVEADGSGSWL